MVLDMINFDRLLKIHVSKNNESFESRKNLLSLGFNRRIVNSIVV